MTTSEEHPDLAGLLRGELSNTVAVAAADHARRCAPCRGALVEDALGHGLLRGSARVLRPTPEVLAARRLDDPDVEPDGMRDVKPDELPRQLGEPRRVRAVRALHAVRRRRAVLAAALVVVAGAGLAVGAGRLGGEGSQEDSGVATRSAVLSPVTGSARGLVVLGTDRAVTRLRVDTEALPDAGRDRFYYAWLLDPPTQKMLPLGVVTAGRETVFEVPTALVSSYSAVDVSLEADDGDPAHSVTSVLRASYAGPGSAS